MFKFAFFGKNKFGTTAFRRKRAKELDGLAIRYVTKRVDDNDNVVGRGGALVTKDGDLIVATADRVVYRSRIDDTDASYLLSNDGVIISGPNLECGGKTETYTAYFVYYRK